MCSPNGIAGLDDDWKPVPHLLYILLEDAQLQPLVQAHFAMLPYVL